MIFPGGATRISIPLSSTFSGSDSTSSAVPPPNSSLKTILKFRSISANADAKVSRISASSLKIISSRFSFDFSRSFICKVMKS